MLKLKFPRREDEREPAPSPPATATVAVLLGRREFLKALGVALAALAAPMTGVRRAWAAARGRFFTRHERATLAALCDRIIPPDADAGAAALGAATYIERLLTAFDHRPPRIFARGPFSDRNPFPDPETGTPSRRRPRNDFRRYIKLTRVQELRWRAELFGSQHVPGADFNDALLGPLTGLRDIYRTSLRHVDEVARAMAGDDFLALGPERQDEIFRLLDGSVRGVGFERDPRRGVTFIDILIRHTLEGCFAPPEYGGNRDLAGWKLVGLEGDDQPLGYSLFSRAANGYNERADHPMSTPNPDEYDAASMTLRPKPLSADGERIQRSIVSLAGLFGE